jgi:hypothetical protein
MSLGKFSKKNVCQPRALGYFLMEPFVQVSSLPGQKQAAVGSTSSTARTLPALIQGCLPTSRGQLRELAGESIPSRCLHWIDSTCYNPAESIYWLLKQVHPDTEIRESGMAAAVSYTKFLCHAIVESAIALAQQATSQDYSEEDECEAGWLEKFAKDGGDVVHISARTIQNAVFLVIPGELAQHAVGEGTVKPIDT